MRLPAHVPAGVALQYVNGISFGKSHSVAIVELDYVGRGPRTFTLEESKLHAAISSMGGTRSLVQIGRMTGRLVEWKTRRVHKLDLI